MSGDRKLVLKLDNKGHVAEVFSTFIDDDGPGMDSCHVATIQGPTEAHDLFRLLDELHDCCCVCSEPLWVATANECAQFGLFCADCNHPDCSALECERGRVAI